MDNPWNTRRIGTVAVAALALVLGLWAVLRSDSTPTTAGVPEHLEGVREEASRPQLPVPEPAPETTPITAGSSPAPEEASPGFAAESAALHPVSSSPEIDRLIGIVLYGTVTGIRGRESDCYGVLITNEREERWLGPLQEGGGYSISGLPPGRYTLQSGGWGTNGHEESLALSPDEPVVRKDIELQPADSVQVKVVTPEGVPIYEAMRAEGLSPSMLPIVPVVTREPPGEVFDEIRGSHNNQFGIGSFWQSGFRETLGPGYLGTIFLHEPPPAHVSLVLRHSVLETKPLAVGESEVAFVVSLEELRSRLARAIVRVVDADTEEPVRGKVRLGEICFQGGRDLDERGEALFEDLLPGELKLCIRAEGFAFYQRAVVLEAAVLNDLGCVGLRRAVSIEGRVVDASGKGVATELRLGRIDRSTGRVDYRIDRRGASGEDGLFQVNELEPGEYVVRITGDDEGAIPYAPRTMWTSTAATVDATAGPVRDVKIVAVPPAELVLRPAQKKGERMVFRLREKGGWTVRSGYLHGSDGRKLKVPPGAYTLVLSREGVEFDRRELGLSAEGLVVPIE